ncbi:NAD(P)/FAD-dependent oxidoreductase [Microterricola viridarii]|uniref:Glycine/D-amino acid oxidase n=1 Tax=Microterricola viridarii TaxID=412690 RepID=A0A1H1RNR6_9MICO|nr:FAD-dependent oxidoreductase [Microterricola viridarii]SDS37282.1 Glycine/D-amino acid oxidase [Microterricola viridarii]
MVTALSREAAAPPSLWLDALLASGTDDLRPRPALGRNAAFDVCIVGGGLTGLWTAYYLAKADPSLKIAVLEKHIAGFGASGRNGGWCSSLFPTSAEALKRSHGREAAVAMRQAMIDTVDEVARASAAEGIDCDFAQGGTVSFARNAPQLAAATADVAAAAEYGVDKLELWGAEQVGERFGARGSGSERPLGAVFDPSCARIQPAKLVRGLARVVESLGVSLFEHTEVTNWFARRVRFRSELPDGSSVDGAVSATNIVIAVEGYGAALPRVGRHVLPLYSLMIATEPLSDDVWREIGIEHGQTFTDYRHLVIYGQRTADNRLAFGGRGARYHWGSAIREEYDRDPRVFGHLQRTLADLFPAAADAAITHRWGGPLGVSRDWHATASFNPKTGVGIAGGYVGDGLSTTNLAGRTLSALIRDEQGPLTELPWVNHRSPRWEPEPLRFVGSNLGLLATGLADVEQGLTKRPSLAAKLMAPLTGH